MTETPKHMPLGPGDAFPALTVAKVGGGQLQLPLPASESSAAKYTIAIFYRGHW